MARQAGLVTVHQTNNGKRDEQSDEPKRRIRRLLKSTFFGRRWVIGGDYEVLGLQVAFATGFGISFSTW